MASSYSTKWNWLAALALVLLAGPPALAGEFVINPLRVTLDRSTRASEVVIRNEDKAPLRMQVEAMSWTQDEQGADRYVAAEGLLYFPRAMEIPPGESRIVRVGVRGLPVSREEAYRLFIEELPPAAGTEAPSDGTTLRVYLRVGVAVFVAPAKPERSGEITSLDIKSGQVEWIVANGGNVHIRADQIELVGTASDGSKILSHVYPDRYVLAGMTKSLRFAIDAETCGKLAAIEATLIAERLDLKRKIDVGPGACK